VSQVYRVPLVLTPQVEGGYTITSPMLPGLVTEGDSLDEALENVEDALRATLELYEVIGRPVLSTRSSAALLPIDCCKTPMLETSSLICFFQLGDVSV
jgi:antitoxin HicB